MNVCASIVFSHCNCLEAKDLSLSEDREPKVRREIVFVYHSRGGGMWGDGAQK